MLTAMVHGVGVRVGTDVESVADVASSLVRYGKRYTRRLFTDAELLDCAGTAEAAAPRLTARFAAKEAVLKLLRPAEVVPSWRSIEIRTEPNGAPSVILHGDAVRTARDQGVGPISVSLSHAAGVGTATAVALVTTTEDDWDG